MIIQASLAAERRVAPRFQTRFDAELASGTVLVPVNVRDLSISGCGILIMSGDLDLPEKIGGRGLLHLPAIHHGTFGTILPVNLRNVRQDAGQMIYGLEFAALLPHQSRKLHSVLEAMAQVD